MNCPASQPITVSPSSTLIYVGLTTVLANLQIPTTINIAEAVNVSGNQFTIQYNGALASFTPAPTIYYMAIGQ